MENSLKSRGLSWQPKGRESKVLDKVTITFEQGHIYGIIGPNGSGKSSFLRHVMNFLSVQEGSVSLKDKSVKDYKKKELAREIAFVPQETRMDTDFSAYDVVMTGRNPYQKRMGGISASDREIVEKALSFTRCESFFGQQFSSLSGGEAQRVIIARAVAQETEWMVLDEPAASLDIRNQVELMERLKRLNEEKNTSIIMVLHDINLASAYCDRIIMLRKGKVLYEGETAECLTCSRLEELYGIAFEKVETEKRRLFYPKFV